MEWTIPAFAFPAEAGTHSPAPEGWKAELAYSIDRAVRVFVDRSESKKGLKTAVIIVILMHETEEIGVPLYLT